MHKNIIHRVLSFALAVLILSATTGFTVDMHYCGDEMQSFSVFGEAEACVGMVSEVECTGADHNSDTKRHCTLEKKKCCDDRMLYVQPLEDLNVSISLTSSITDLQIDAVISFRELGSIQPIVVVPVTNFQYRPPLLFRTTPVVLQSFLI